MEGKAVLVTDKRTGVDHQEPYSLRRNKEFEGAVRELGNAKVGGRTANGSLKNDANRAGIKSEFTPPKSNHQSERRGIRGRAADREIHPLRHRFLKTETRSKREAGEDRQRHGHTTGGALTCTLFPAVWLSEDQRELSC